MPETKSSLYSRIETEISSYISSNIEISPGVNFSQYKTINRIYKFKNRDLSGTKLNPDLSYDYFFDIISPRADSEVKNLRFDTKHILVFSQNPIKDFPVVFIANASLGAWMAENGEDDKLKAAVEEFTDNGNIGFKKIKGGYEIVDALNTYITNQRAETIDDTDLIERHEMTASQLMAMSEWDNVDRVIKDCGNKFFTSSTLTTPVDTTANRYEVFEYTGEVSEKEFNEINGLEKGSENTYFLAKVIVAGLKQGKSGEKYKLFADKLKGSMSDHYIYAHRGKYNGRFWRVGMYELLFDHQIRANEIGNQLARGLEWASKVVFRSKDSKVLQNIRADIDNGDVIIAEDLQQLEVRLQGMDQLIADWNRLMADANNLANAQEISRGEAMPSGTPFRMGLLLDQNAGKMFTLLRQKISLPYKRVFREWVMPNLITGLSGQDVFRLIGDTDILDQLREVIVNSWYMQNLVKIGPHTKETAEAIKAEKLDELRNQDPVIENSKEIWKGVMPRLFITITGENSDIQDQIQDIMQLIQYEQDPERVDWMLNLVYKARNIPIPPKREQEPAETQIPQRQGEQPQKTNQRAQEAQQPVMQ